jgi:hypothetical protein
MAGKKLEVRTLIVEDQRQIFRATSQTGVA